MELQISAKQPVSRTVRWMSWYRAAADVPDDIGLDATDDVITGHDAGAGTGHAAAVDLHGHATAVGPGDVLFGLAGLALGPVVEDELDVPQPGLGGPIEVLLGQAGDEQQGAGFNAHAQRPQAGDGVLGDGGDGQHQLGRELVER
jgi:hypothetical protein